MATIDSKDFIDRLIANDGHYEDDPQVIEIASYRTVEGKLTYHVSWSIQDMANLRTSPLVSDIQILWVPKQTRLIPLRACCVCGNAAELDGLGCCSEECDRVAELRDMEILGEDEIPF